MVTFINSVEVVMEKYYGKILRRYIKGPFKVKSTKKLKNLCLPAAGSRT